MQNVYTYDNIYKSPNGLDGPPNGPDGPPNGSGRRSRRPSAPTVQPNQTKNNNTPTIASLGYTGPSYISDWGRIYHLYIRPWPIYPSPKMIYCLYIVYVWKKYTENIGKSRSTRIATEKSNSCSHWRELHFSNENYVWKKCTENIGMSRSTRIATEKSNSRSCWQRICISRAILLRELLKK